MTDESLRHTESRPRNTKISTTHRMDDVSSAEGQREKRRNCPLIMSTTSQGANMNQKRDAGDAFVVWHARHVTELFSEGMTWTHY